MARTKASARVAMTASVLLLSALSITAAAARALDDFADASAWTAIGSDDVDARLRSVVDRDGSAMCLDFDFHGVSGYAALRRDLPIDYRDDDRDDYAFTFRVRGDAPANTLQFKLADASGDNVWWHVDDAFSFAHDWRPQRIRKRDIGFAWGPAKDRTLRHSRSLELTVYAGNGGRGEVCFDRLALETIAPVPAPLAIPVARASSSAVGKPAANAVDGDLRSVWRSARGGEQALTLDFGAERAIGGLVLHWLPGESATRYDIEASADGNAWRNVRRVVAGNGGVDPLALRDLTTRYLRIVMHAGSAAAYALGDIEIRNPAFGASANAFFSALAKAAPRGRYPRGFYGEQTYWTIVGVDGGHQSGLLSEDGALEVARGGFSIEPFLLEDDSSTIDARAKDSRKRLTTWADVAIDHALDDGYLPLPSVTWRRDGVTLTTNVFAAGARGASRLVASYRLENTTDRPRALTLALAVRPFQVNPSVQFLNTPGGVSPIHDLAFVGNALAVDGTARVFALERPDRFAASAFDAGMIVDRLAEGGESDRASVPTAAHDDAGLASGALLYRAELAAHSARTFGLVVPLDGRTAIDAMPGGSAAGWISSERRAVAANWRAHLDTVRLRVPAVAQPLADTLRTALAHILISRDGSALRPGTRAYARSWIRDGAMIADALLRLGRADVARAYLDWYAPHQFKSGKVPCCVDERGSDPVAENDSHGELIHLAWAVYRYTRDKPALASIWPRIERAVAYMDGLRASQRMPANLASERRAFYGLMPASISHEGYSAKPMHSYWDDFWALTGYAEATAIATVLGDDIAAQSIAAAREQFRADLHASIIAATKQQAIDYLSGAAELGDFDPTSTTIALTPAGEQAALPRDLLYNTFERYWRAFVARRDGAAWKDYTPYEWRNVGAFVRLGWRDRARQAIDFLMRDRRPAAWNQWAEVVGRDPRESRFVGDMPHGWVASDFIRATLDLFAYERESDSALILAAGIPAAWLDGDGTAIENLRTPYGRLSYSLRRDDAGEHLAIGGDGLHVPPGGFVFASPDTTPGGAIKIVRGSAAWHEGALRITEVPTEIVVQRLD